ncbi:Hypothetical predicted protein, partial [Pelobates cultripes]
TPRSSNSGSQTGPMVGLLHYPAGASHAESDSNMTPSPPSSLVRSDHSTLDIICADLRSLASMMATKQDFQTLTSTPNDTITSEMSLIRTE